MNHPAASLRERTKADEAPDIGDGEGTANTKIETSPSLPANIMLCQDHIAFSEKVWILSMQHVKEIQRAIRSSLQSRAQDPSARVQRDFVALDVDQSLGRLEIS